MHRESRDFRRHKSQKLPPSLDGRGSPLGTIKGVQLKCIETELTLNREVLACNLKLRRVDEEFEAALSLRARDCLKNPCKE